MGYQAQPGSYVMMNAGINYTTCYAAELFNLGEAGLNNPQHLQQKK